MKAQEFCYWLQGFFELRDVVTFQHPDAAPKPAALSSEQVEVIQKHLALVFTHDIDPKAGPAPVQEQLNAIHGNKGGTPRC